MHGVNFDWWRIITRELNDKPIKTLQTKEKYAKPVVWAWALNCAHDTAWCVHRRPVIWHVKIKLMTSIPGGLYDVSYWSSFGRAKQQPIVCYIEHIEQILSLIFSWTGIRWITYSEMVKNQFSNCLENLFSPFNYQIVGLL